MHDLTCETSAPGRARHWITERLHAALRDDPDAGRLVEDAVLCASELVTNALQAGCTAVTLRLHTDERSVRVSLIDDAPGQPEPRVSGPLDLSGRGLMIIDAVSRTWGVDRADSGKEVWVELGRTA